MKSGYLKFHLAPYGAAETAVKELADQDTPYKGWLRTALRRPSGHIKRQIWVASSEDLGADFVKQFRKHSVPDARLLLMDISNEGSLTDLLFSHLMAMQIRSAQRVYVADFVDAGPEKLRSSLGTLFQRLAAASASQEDSDRILNAKIMNDVLHMVSSSFNRLEVPLAKIPSLADKNSAAQQEYKIDEDGAFIYWPQLDVHLGWEQLKQIVDPAAALKAQQKHHEFNIRYGRALRILREKMGIKIDEIPGLSEKQLRRIERGECRLTSNAIVTLAKSFKISANEFMNRLAESLSFIPA